jgi:hypothetical protein
MKVVSAGPHNYSLFSFLLLLPGRVEAVSTGICSSLHENCNDAACSFVVAGGIAVRGD